MRDQWTQITIVCNAELWIEQNLRHHAPFFGRQIVVEGASIEPGTLGNGLRITNGSPSSTDRTVEILRACQEWLPNLYVIRNNGQPWNGKTEMMNAALEYAKPGWIMQIDADEFWFPKDMLTLQQLGTSWADAGFTDVAFYAKHFWGDMAWHTKVYPDVWGNQLEWRRLFRWDGSTQWESHEPPRFKGHRVLLDREATRNLGIEMMHYGYAPRCEMVRREKYYALKPGELTGPRDKWIADGCPEQGPPGPMVYYQGPHPLDIRWLIGT